MLKHKKGFELSEAVTLISAGVIILVTLSIFWPWLSSSNKDSDTKSLPNFEKNLVPEIKTLLKSDKKMDYTQTEFSIATDKSIIGYNKFWSSSENLELLGRKMEKPKECKDNACLCFLVGVPSSQGTSECAIFDKVSYFLKDNDAELDDGYGNPLESEHVRRIYSVTPSLSAPGTKILLFPEVFINTEYRLLVLNGVSFDKDKTLYIEKYQNSRGEIIIYIAPVNDNTRAKINERRAYINSMNNK